MIRQLLVLFIFLSSATFFRLAFLPRQLLLVLSFGSTILMAFIYVVNLIYENKKGFKQNFGGEIFLLLFSVILSMFGARWGHSQSFLLTAWIQSGLYFYFLYFFLHTIRIKPVELERLIIIMAVIYLVLFFAQYILYPMQLFNTRIQEARGTIRIFVPGGIFAGFIFFYFLLLFLKSYKIKYGIFCLIYLIIPILQGTRSSILVTIFGVLIVILISKQVKSRIVVFLLMIISSALIFFIFQDIFINLIEVSQEQSAQDDDDIRIRSARFFLTEFYPNKLNYLIGNGEGHMMSPYGLKIMYYKASFGFYQSDLGVLGVYTMYGIFFVFGMYLIIKKIFRIRIAPRYSYIKYWAVILILNSILGDPFINATSIAVLSSALYILDVSNYEIKARSLQN